MINTERLLTMKLHEELTIYSDALMTQIVKRVIGGWIYYTQSFTENIFINSVFVPYSDVENDMQIGKL